MKDSTSCVHHWMIDSPSGTTSKGICKYCQSQRDFYNSPDYMREGGNQWKRQGEGTWADKQRVAKLAKANGQSA